MERNAETETGKCNIASYQTFEPCSFVKEQGEENARGRRVNKPARVYTFLYIRWTLKSSFIEKVKRKMNQEHKSIR